MNDFNRFIEQLNRNGQRSNWRSVVVLAGPEQWAISLLSDLLSPERCIWIGQGVWPSCITPNKAKSVLGKQCQHLIFNCYSGFNPDAFGIASGTLAGGGICFMICPEFSQWPQFADPDYLRYVASPQEVSRVNGYFIRRAIDIINAQSSCYVVAPDAPLPQLISSVSTTFPQDVPAPYASYDQQAAVAEIIKTVSGHRRRPLVISADRGRGKSAALGLAAGQLLISKLNHIVITAPSIAAIDSVFRHCAQLLDGAVVNKLSLNWQGKTLEFIAPDKLILQLPRADLLLVDEAAAIPTSMLATIAKHYSRLVFATTIHGYEGTGRGFALRFMRQLASIAPSYRTLNLAQPIRWAAHDPLEQMTYQLLGLKASAANVDSLVDGDCRAKIEFRRVTQRQLLDEPALLEQLFGLLVLAHYQTSPSDFRQLLDAPDLTIFIATIEQQLVATALVLTEGTIEPTLAQQIWSGQRRLRGHLLPQSLLAQVGLQNAGDFSYGRIMRIAVQPQLHRRGIGLLLDQHIAQWAMTQQLDFIGASFGVTPDLIGYWQALNYQPLRLGLNRDSASGTHSVMVLKPLGQQEQQGQQDQNRQLVVQAQQSFYHNFRYALSAEFKALEFELVVALLASLTTEQQMSAQDHLNLEVYIEGSRPFELVAHSISQLIWVYANQLTQLSPKYQQILIIKVLQQQAWNNCSDSCGTSGRKVSEALLKSAVAELYQLR